MTNRLQHEGDARNAVTPDEEWASACDELIAALKECERRNCGISNDVSLMLDIIVRDQSFGAVSVRHVARTIRREMPAMTALSREVEAARVRFWRERRVNPGAPPWSAKGGR